MAITSSTTTAFDVPQLVSQLMAVERRPIDQLQTKISNYQAKTSSWGTLSSLLSSFEGAAAAFKNSLDRLSATPSDASVFSAIAGSQGIPGSYTVNVTQLAQSQNLVAAGQTSATAAIGDGSPTTVVFEFGAISGGTLVGGQYSGASFVANGSGSASVTIDSSNNSLEGIRDAINAAKLGVTATIVNDGSSAPYRLVLTGDSTGANSSLRITTSGGDGSIDNLLAYAPDGVQNLLQTRATQDARLSVNGIEITSPSNTIAGAIQGVSLTLKNTTTVPATLVVSRDTTVINSAASDFVDAYNALATQFKSRSAFGTATSTGGVLAGDGTIRALQSQLHTIFTSPASGGTLTTLGQIGIAFQKDGSLRLDGGKLASAISSSFSDVVNLVSSPSGFATRLEAWGKAALAPGGPVDTRIKSLNDYVKNYNAQVDRLENQMVALEKKYRKEYTNLNLLLSSMNSTSTFLTQQLTNIPSSK